MKALPSIRGRLARSLLGWSLVWSLAVTAAVWLAVRHEVEELLDDALLAAAEVMGSLLSSDDPAALDRLMRPAANGAGERFAWQVIGADARLLQRSPQAPAEALRATPTAGFSNQADWRVYGMPLGSDGRMLYVAQSHAERIEAQTELALSSALAALAVALLGYLWLRERVRHELAPLQALSDRLAAHEPLLAGATLGAAEREELQPVQAAIDGLAQRLSERVAHERAFTAHAAHSLRTPLAGIDAQLAVALRECPPELQPRLQRVRDAAGRLQRVVAALLGLFRAGVELQRQPVDLAALLARLPVDGLDVRVQGSAPLQADPDLLAAALANLLDNALRWGARQVTVSVHAPATLRLDDDGPGVGAERRQALQAALDEQAYEDRTGLGLMLADMVARAHGGTLRLPEPAAGGGFSVELRLA